MLSYCLEIRHVNYLNVMNLKGRNVIFFHKKIAFPMYSQMLGIDWTTSKKKKKRKEKLVRSKKFYSLSGQ